MKLPELELPSNRKFGFFFSGLFLIAAVYSMYIEILSIAFVFFTMFCFLIVISLFLSKLLLPFNKIWMFFGFFLGLIISPIVMGIIFFGLITPYGMIMRIMGRDELKLIKNKNKSYWTIRSQNEPQTNFKQQF